MKTTKTFYPLLLAVSVQAALSSNFVMAQEQDESAEVELEIIEVTARKSSESIFEVPIAISAFSAADIEDRGLTDINDLSAITPGFQYESFASIPGRFDNSPRFRGVSVNTGSPTRQTASVFVDGVYVSNGVQGIGLEDVERIEIIKGPQSAYFGRLTFSGAVNYVTKTPDEDWLAKISGNIATEGDQDLQLSAEGALGTDWIRGRISASTKEKGSQYKTPSGQELGEENTDSIGATLFFEPNDNFSARIRAYYFENDDGAPASALVGLDKHNCGPFGGTDTTVCGDLPFIEPDQNLELVEPLLNKLSSLTALNGSNRDTFGLDREALRLSAQFSYDIPNSDLQITGQIAKNDSEVRLLRDADETGDDAFYSFSGRKFEDTSAEIRISGGGAEDKLNWSIGFNVFDQEFTNNGTFIAPALGYFAFNGGEFSQDKISTQGLFGSLGYKLTENVRVSLEGRYQIDDVEEDDDLSDDVPAASGEFKNFLPRVIFDWTPNKNELVYVSYSEGNLPGGFNGEVAGLNPEQLAELRGIQSTASEEFDEEKLANTEFGWKYGANDFNLKIAAFFMNRTNQAFRRADLVNDPTSTSGFDQIDYFINAGKSESVGVEVEGATQLTNMFRIEGSAAYIKSEYKVFNSGTHNEIYGTEDASGQETERFPNLSGSLSGIWEGEFESGLEWFARADAFYSGSKFVDEINLTEQEANMQLNLRTGVLGDNYRVELYVTNATDDDSYASANRFRDLSSRTPLFDFSTFGYSVAYRDKRQVGVRFSYTFE